MAKAKKAKGQPALVRDEYRGRGHGLTKPEREAIYQAYLALGTKAAAARSLGISPITVYKVCREIEASADPKQLQASRDMIASQLTGRLHESTNEILDSITPDDLKSGRIALKDKDGAIVGYKEFGPSLLQKTTSVGILTDKMRVLVDFSKAIGQDLGSGQLLMPDNRDQLIAAIRSRVKSIQVLNVNFREDNPELATRLDTVAEVAVIEDEEVEVDLGNSRSEFDN